MAKFKQELPNAILKQVETLEKNTEQMLKDMTKAGAEVAYTNAVANLPASWRSSEIMNCLKITKSYKTPSDDGVATKVGIYGYFTNHEGRRVPAPLVANITEYGSSKRNYPKHPFFRKAFKRAQIEAAMKAIQDKYIPKG
jgi:HK97 gp10 family phage protein